MQTINTYSFNELSEDVQADLVSKRQADNMNSDIHYWIYDEVDSSLNALFEVFGVKKTYSRYSSSIEFLHEYRSDVWHLKGKRAMSFLENNLLKYLRREKAYIYKREGKNVVLPKNSLEPEKLSGLCYDDSFVTELISDVMSCRYYLGQCVEYLIDKRDQLIEREIDFLNSDEQVREELETNGAMYTENGIEV